MKTIMHEANSLSSSLVCAKTFKNRKDSLQLIIHQQLRYIQIKAPMCMTYDVEAWCSYKERISHEKKKKTIIGLCWAIYRHVNV